VILPSSLSSSFTLVSSEGREIEKVGSWDERGSAFYRNSLSLSLSLSLSFSAHNFWVFFFLYLKILPCKYKLRLGSSTYLFYVFTIICIHRFRRKLFLERLENQANFWVGSCDRLVMSDVPFQPCGVKTFDYNLSLIECVHGIIGNAILRIFCS